LKRHELSVESGISPKETKFCRTVVKGSNCLQKSFWAGAENISHEGVSERRAIFFDRSDQTFVAISEYQYRGSVAQTTLPCAFCKQAYRRRCRDQWTNNL